MTEPGQVENREHYPFITRSLIDAYNSGELTNVENIDIEPKYGYTTRITYDDGSHRVTYGGDLGLNPSAAGELAADKGHTKFMLRKIGVKAPEGEEFLTRWWANHMNRQRMPEDALMFTADAVGEYIESHFGYPAYIKPTDGSRGSGVHKTSSKEDLPSIVDEYSEDRVKVAVVEEAVDMPDYRVVMLDGELISAYQRSPLEVVGDGKSTIKELLESLQEGYIETGRDTKIDIEDARLTKRLGSLGLSLASVVPDTTPLVLADISNLSVGGNSTDVTSEISPKWVDLSAYIAENFNLRLCGVDLACEDITSEDADYSVIEVNSRPGLDNYAFSGEEQKRAVLGFYTKVFNAYPRQAV